MPNFIEEFTKENIDLYFSELSKEYKRLGGRNFPIEIILIGGAAIIENYSFRCMTTDVDAILPTIGIMKEAINNVGDKLGLPSGWLNSDFMKTSSYSTKLRMYSKFYKTFNQFLDVRIVSGEYLIAMKLKSGREYKNDLSDIIGILFEHEKRQEPITYEMISNAIEVLYGGWDEINDRARSFIKFVFENGNFEEMYTNIKESEIKTKEILLAFNEKYPNVVNEKNIDSIVADADKNSDDAISVRAVLERIKKEAQNK